MDTSTLAAYFAAFINLLGKIEGDLDAATFFIEPDRIFSKGRLFYHDLTVDTSTSSVYVGAMNTIYKLWYKNINDTSNQERYIEREILPTEQAVMNCAYKSRDQETQCQNYIRVFAKLADNTLFVCGTNAYNPKVYKLNAESMKILDDNINGAAICAVGPNDNTTALWVEKGNPTDAPTIYAATVTDFTQTNRIIYRPPLIDEKSRETVEPFMRTIHTDSKWLNEPNFVGSFEVDQFAYFFFRETAVEFINCGKAIYSRVARICKKDTGGQHVLKQNWATFLKARLNCSISGEFPFYFDEIQDVVKTTDFSGNVYFDAVFTTSLNGLYGSAICSFSLKAINEVFDKGAFKEQSTSASTWLPVLPGQIPVPRPGQCVENTKSMSDTALHFIKSHSLMDTTIATTSSENGNDQIIKPLYYKRDVIFKKLAIDKFESQDTTIFVIFVATDRGEVYKIVQWLDAKKYRRSKLLAVYQLANRQPIKSIKILSGEFLYITQDEAVSQVNLPALCVSYKLCFSCSLDPYCYWNNGKDRCEKAIAEQQTNSQMSMNASTCGVKMRHSAKLAYPGGTVYMDCSGVSGFINQKSTVHWIKDKQGPIKAESRRYLRTDDGGLVIVNASSIDSGQYECVLEGQTIHVHKLLINDINCEMPQNVQSYRAVYKEWCREFQEYKYNMGEWSKQRTNHLQCSSTKTGLNRIPSKAVNVNFSDRRAHDSVAEKRR